MFIVVSVSTPFHLEPNLLGWLGSRWYSGYSIGLVIDRLRVRLPVVALPSSLGQLSLPSLRGR